MNWLIRSWTGLSDKLDLEDIAKKHDVPVEKIEEQHEMGKEIEKEEHGQHEQDISKDHLTEFPDYYTRLEDMEEKAKEYLKKK